MDVYLFIGIVVGSACALLYVGMLRKDRDYYKSRYESTKAEIQHKIRVIDKSNDRYSDLLNNIKTELDRLEKKVKEFKQSRDPNAMFPSMEGSIEEVNAISNFRMLQRLYKDLTNPE